jgi:hypothetical protein
VKDQILHPHKTTRITVLRILMFNFLKRNCEDKGFCSE